MVLYVIYIEFIFSILWSYICQKGVSADWVRYVKIIYKTNDEISYSSAVKKIMTSKSYVQKYGLLSTQSTRLHCR